MSAVEREIKIIKLNEERLKAVKELKEISTFYSRSHQDDKFIIIKTTELSRRIEQINHEIKELIYG